MDSRHPTALISYSHDSAEHERKVLDLCNRLRARGVDAFVDQFLSGAPPEGWPLWMERQIERRDFTLMVCTETYRRRFMEEESKDVGRGVVWEARILRNLLYEDSTRQGRIVPVLLDPEARRFVPVVFRGNFYDVSTDAGFEHLLRHVLQEPGAVASDLGALGPEGSRWSAFERPWLVPDTMRTRYFTGRDALLAKIREQLATKHRAAISGLGGAGKTQTAIEFAVRHRADYPDGVFWINAETESGLTSGFVEIAKVLRLSASASDDQEHIVAAVRGWLDANDKWLLIFDNVEERRAVLPFVPQRGKGDVLITSRETVFQELGIARALEATEFGDHEAVTFLLARTGRGDDERAVAGALARELGSLPLALEQAAAYIAETNAGIADYLTAFRKRRVALLERAKDYVAHETVATTWSANFAAVETSSPASADVLRAVAFLGADAIPFEIFSRGAHALGEAIASAVADADELAVGELMRPLVRYSLIRSDPATRTIGVHRLVQEIVRNGMVEAERRSWTDRAACALDAVFPAVTYATWAAADRLVAHAFAMSPWTDPGAFAADSEPAARVMRKAGDYLNQRGRYDDARKLHERALSIRERVLGPDDPDVATTLTYLAAVYENLGRYEEAARLQTRALAIRERALGADHPDVAWVLNGLANAQTYLGRYAEAGNMYERCIAIFENAPEKHGPQLAIALGNLANIHLFRGAYAEAGPLYERAAALMERAHGPDAPKVAIFINGMADVHYYLGRYAEAEATYERARSIFEQALGPDHDVVAASVDGLANTYAAQQRFDDAETLFKRAVEIRERALGADHPQTAIALAALGDFYVDRERWAEARTLFERALKIDEAALPADHPSLARFREALQRIESRDRGAPAQRPRRATSPAAR
jgi:tetratricopeptide (TPR) repeat protein